MLGGGAALCNYWLVYVYTSPEEFICIIEDIAPGEVILNKVQTQTLGGNVKSLLKVAVSGKDYESLLAGRRAARQLKKGDLLLWQDVIQPTELQPGLGEDGLSLSLDGVAVIPQLLLVGQRITFVVNPPVRNDDLLSGRDSRTHSPEPELVGPFRLLSVGPRLNRTADDSDRSDPAGRNITIAIPEAADGALDSSTRRLLLAIMGSDQDRSAIKAIILHRSQARPGESIEDDNAGVGQTILKQDLAE
jgi:hypothetical protein